MKHTNPEEWELHTRLYVTEAICAHGIGHHRGIHGCDGCCRSMPEEIKNQTTLDE